ncbi:MAG: OmpH family outer membrane protein [Paludibacteraceae bacterium]|nr:OmpH family outer membrane protein [Paludibacteraceae bacterium]
MKKLIIALMLLLPFGLTAQEMKFGHINKSAVLELMPEADDAQRQLEDMNLKYRMQIKAMEEEITKKEQEYQEQADSLDATIRRYKETELQRLYQSYQEFGKTAQETLSKKAQELMTPIEAKINKAVEQVGKDNGFLYIFDVTTPGTFAYMSDKSVDVLPLVKKALGL